VASLMSGVLGLGQPSQLGRMFSRTLLYYVCTSLLAIVTGLAMVNLIRPGLGGVNPPAGLEPPSVSGNLGDVLFGQVEKMIPTNPINAVAQSEFLSIISFSIAFSIFTIFVGGKVADTIRQLAKASFEVMMAMTMAIVKLAPIGVTFGSDHQYGWHGTVRGGGRTVYCSNASRSESAVADADHSGLHSFVGEHRRGWDSPRWIGDDGHHLASSKSSSGNARHHHRRRPSARYVPHKRERLERFLRVCCRRLP
jgi:hypothetical protein